MNTRRLIKGTLILTGAGFLCRFLGFFYRIYLSRQFSDESIGIYQLISPLCSLVFAITVSGLQTAISKFVAASPKNEPGQPLAVLFTGSVFSILLSLSLSALIYGNSDTIATLLLKEERTAPLIRIFSLSIPFASIHSCINGYFYGMQQTKLPALSQLLEQLVRITTLVVVCEILRMNDYIPLIQVAVIGMVTGEFASAAYSILFLCGRLVSKYPSGVPVKNKEFSLAHIYTIFNNLLSMSWPLTASRVILTLLLSIEAAFLPSMLEQYGMSTAAALGTYGILTGMSLPFVLFPNAITNSLSVLLLPMISEADGKHQTNDIVKATRRCIKYSLLWGSLCSLAFFSIGPVITNWLFQNEQAGFYVRQLSFICPFLYLASTTGSILHGLGRTKITFLYQLLSISVRLVFVFFLVPTLGLSAYFSGLLSSQLLLCLFYLLALRKYMYYT